VEYRRWKSLYYRGSSPWKSFESFYADLGPVIGDKKFLKKKDRSQPHSKTNSHWGASVEYKYAGAITYRGKTKSILRWSKYLGITAALLQKRVEKCNTCGRPIEEAVMTGKYATAKGGAQALPPGIDESLFDRKVHVVEFETRKTPVSRWTFRRLLRETAKVRGLKFAYAALGNKALVQIGNHALARTKTSTKR
jgi:hypothetical protein